MLLAAVLGRLFFTSTSRSFGVPGLFETIYIRVQQNHPCSSESRNLRPLRKSWHGSAVEAWTRNPGPSQMNFRSMMLKQFAIWFLLHLTCKLDPANFLLAESAVETFLHLSVRRAGISCGVQGAALSSHLSSKLSHKGNQEVERILKVSCRKRRIAILGHSAKKDR